MIRQLLHTFCPPPSFSSAGAVYYTRSGRYRPHEEGGPLTPSVPLAPPPPPYLNTILREPPHPSPRPQNTFALVNTFGTVPVRLGGAPGPPAAVEYSQYSPTNSAAALSKATRGTFRTERVKV